MKIGRHDIIRWAISGVAFIGTLAVASGCAETVSPPGPTAIKPVAAPVQPPVATLPVEVLGDLAAPDSTAVAQPSSAAFQRHTFASDGRDSDVAVDPSGKWLVYTSTRHSERPDLYLQKTDGVSVVRLTDDPADDAFPVFSPDGKTIAFSSTRSGNWDVYTMDTDGKHVVQVTSGPSQDLHPSFSPDGTRLVYCSLSGRGDNWEIWVANLSTGERRIVGSGLFPTWSPDKGLDRIAFQRARQRGSRTFSLWTLDLVDGEARRVTEVASLPDAAIVSPAWSPDGQKLAFATIHGAKKEVWTVDADGSNRQRLTDGVASNLNPTWAADNRIYFISDRGSAGSIWSVRADQPTPATALGDSPAAKPQAAAKVNPAPVAQAKHDEPKHEDPKHDEPKPVTAAADQHEAAPH
jgi:Tol biopolymer transport system component